MKIASLDLGSNTFLLLISEVENGRIKTILHDEIKYVRLAEGLGPDSSGKIKIADAAMNRAKEALKDFAVPIASHRPDVVLAMGTSALRDAENRSELIDFAEALDISVEIIPGSQEAEVTNAGAFSGRDLSQSKQKNFLVIDIGGGSTEIILSQIVEARSVKIKASKSYNVGCVRLKERHQVGLPANDESMLNVENDLKSAIADFQMAHMSLLHQGIDEVIAVAGTPTTIAMAEYKVSKISEIEGRKLNQSQLQNWLLKTKRMNRGELISLGIPEGRVDVISVGIATLLSVLKTFNIEELTVSTRGVRHGIALLAAKRSNEK